MRIKEKIISILSLLILLGLAWYFFVKPYDYLATIKTKTTIGTINQSIKSWSASLEKASIIKQQGLDYLEQEITINDSTYVYTWKIDKLQDSLSKVSVYVKDKDHSFKNKLSTIFGTTDFEKRSKRTVLDFNNRLNNHLKNFKVSIKGEALVKPTYCAYVSLKGSQIEKAKGMMQNYGLLSLVLLDNKIELNGRPFVEVTNWNIETDSIEYNFCYPIIKTDSLPKNKLIKYKQVESRKAIKAVYNGNYITSDRAWYEILAYAEKNGILLEKTPLEFFYNNPNMGGNELSWKAEIFMPIK